SSRIDSEGLLHPGQGVLDILLIDTQAGHEGTDAGGQLGHHQRKQQRHHAEQQDITQYDGDTALAVEKFFGKKAGGNIQHVGQHNAPGEGTQDIEKFPQPARQGGQLPRQPKNQGYPQRQPEKIPGGAGYTVQPFLQSTFSFFKDPVQVRSRPAVHDPGPQQQ